MAASSNHLTVALPTVHPHACSLLELRSCAFSAPSWPPWVHKDKALERLQKAWSKAMDVRLSPSCPHPFMPCWNGVERNFSRKALLLEAGSSSSSIALRTPPRPGYHNGLAWLTETPTPIPGLSKSRSFSQKSALPQKLKQGLLMRSHFL